jgi:CYTH domain-containing protein
MAREIERKFLVSRERWHADPVQGVRYRQGYLSTDPARVVRVRTAGPNAFLTIKGVTKGIERAEYEYPIPLDDADQLLDRLCVQPLVEKTRYRIPSAGRTWEVDEFAGVNAGLIVAEVELDSPGATVVLPEWVEREVSGDPRYFNSNLAAHPFSEWGRP